MTDAEIHAAIAKDARAPATTVASARSKILSAIAQAGAALIGLAEAMALDSQLQELIDKGAGFDAATYSTLDHLDETIEQLADAVRLAIEAAGMIPPHQRMYAAIQRYQEGDD